MRELTAAIASGQPEAMACLFDAWFDFVHAEARRCTGRDEQFCMDVVQETMLRVIRRIKPLESEAALAAWLRTATRSAAIDLLRKELRTQKREQRRARDTHEAVSNRAAVRSDTEARLCWLRSQFAMLDPVTVRALDFRYRLGWTLGRIGTALKLTPGAVDGRMSRAIEHLRDAAQEHPND